MNNSSDRLIAIQRLRQLSTPGRLRVALRAGTVAVLLAAWGTAVAMAFTWWLLALVPVTGFLLSGFINAAHDCVHRAHVRSVRGNRLAGVAWATPIFLNFSIYRQQHLTHHRHTGVEGDTEPETVLTNLREYLHDFSAIAFWPSVFRRMKRTVIGSFPAGVTNDAHRRAARQDNTVLMSWLALVLTLTVLVPLPLLVGYWLPLGCGYIWISWLSLPEHYGLWGVPDVDRNTRTVLAPALLRFFQWNGNYHAEHHRYPAVASVKLHELAREIGPHPVQEPSYLAFHRRLVISLARGDLAMNDVHGLKAAAATDAAEPGCPEPASPRGALS
ncbi:fatty acid desaturase [Streptomyces sp. NPDC006208]|uniref:fatty acid desaturase family protein n=1 Tax=Streptomyces sp. NPDC006208 TaxID=3156734 RepID=UPI0033BA103D